MDRDRRARPGEEQLARIRTDLAHIKWLLGGILALLGLIVIGSGQFSGMLVWWLGGAVAVGVLYSMLKLVEKRVHQKTAGRDAEARMQEIIAAYQAKNAESDPKDDA